MNILLAGRDTVRLVTTLFELASYLFSDSRCLDLYRADARRASEYSSEASGRDHQQGRTVPATYLGENARVDVYSGVHQRGLETAYPCVGLPSSIAAIFSLIAFILDLMSLGAYPYTTTKCIT